MTYTPERDRIPLEELLKPVSAKVVPLRKRYSIGTHIPMTEAEARGSAAGSISTSLARKRGK